jgi:hypothetical protein
MRDNGPIALFERKYLTIDIALLVEVDKARPAKMSTHRAMAHPLRQVYRTDCDAR